MEGSDLFWQKVKPLILLPQRDPNQQSLRKPGEVREPVPARKIFERIVCVLHTGYQWKALQKEGFGGSSAICAHFLGWAESVFC